MSEDVGLKLLGLRLADVIYSAVLSLNHMQQMRDEQILRVRYTRNGGKVHVLSYSITYI